MKRAHFEGKGQATIWKTPNGRMVLVLFGIAAVCMAFLAGIWEPDLSALAKGPLLDHRFIGYDLEEARGILYHLGEEGRARYASPYLLVDCLFALSMAAALCLGSLWCLARFDGLKGRWATILPAIAVVMPIMAGLFDLWENYLLMKMADLGVGIDAGLVKEAIRATSFKFGFYLFGSIAFLLCGWFAIRAKK